MEWDDNIILEKRVICKNHIKNTIIQSINQTFPRRFLVNAMCNHGTMHMSMQPAYDIIFKT